MATQADHAATADHAAAAEHSEHADHPDYVKIWWILLVLLAISFLGPFLGVRWVTLLTAFGIAFVKAWLVAKNFMHLTIQPRYVAYLLATALVFMLLLYAGVAPDVMKDRGTNWTKPAVAEQPVHGPGH